MARIDESVPKSGRSASDGPPAASMRGPRGAGGKPPPESTAEKHGAEGARPGPQRAAAGAPCGFGATVGRAVRLVPGLLLLAAAAASRAETPVGWISLGNPSAYTQDAGRLELGLSGIAVNDALDFLDLREDLIAENDNLAGDTGDIRGARLDIEFGVASFLTAFASAGRHDMTVELGDIRSAVIESADGALETEFHRYGLRWMVWRGDPPPGGGRGAAASLEVSGFGSDSQDFDLVISRFQTSNLKVNFMNHQTFSVDRLKDSGWSARLLYSAPLSPSLTGTVWLGHGAADATFGTGSDLTSSFLRGFFEQSFSVKEEYARLGVGLNWRAAARLPVAVGYEVIKINETGYNAVPESLPLTLPGFFRAGRIPDDYNHVFSARASWWITPRISIGLSGRLFSNHFLGVFPHYNNPLADSFRGRSYGFAGVELGVRF